MTEMAEKQKQKEFNCSLRDLQNDLLKDQRPLILQLLIDIFKVIVKDNSFSNDLQQFIEKYKQKQVLANQNGSHEYETPQDNLQNNSNNPPSQSQSNNQEIQKEQNTNLIQTIQREIEVTQQQFIEFQFMKEQQIIFQPDITDLLIFNKGECEIYIYFELLNRKSNQSQYLNVKECFKNILNKQCNIRILVTNKNIQIHSGDEDIKYLHFGYKVQLNLISLRLIFQISNGKEMQQIQIQSPQFVKYAKIEEIIEQQPKNSEIRLQKLSEISRLLQLQLTPRTHYFKTINLKFQLLSVLTNFRIGLQNLEDQQKNEIEYDMQGYQWENKKKTNINKCFKLQLFKEIEIRQVENKIKIFFNSLKQQTNKPELKIIKPESESLELWEIQENAKMGINFIIYNINDKINIFEQ